MHRSLADIIDIKWVIPVSIVLMLTGCGLFLPDDEATWVLKDLAAGDEPSHLKDITCPPNRQSISYSIQDRFYQADVYLPAQTPLAAMVLSPGLAETGRHDPRLVAFATTLARARFLILIPDLPNLRALKVREEDVQGLVDAFGYLQARDELDDTTPAGIGAFSYTAGPAVLAAHAAEIRHQVDFVLGVGGYYDLRQVVRFFTTGYFQKQGQWHQLEPNQYGKWVFILSNVDLLSDEKDRQTLHRMAERKLEKPEAQIDDLVSQLTAEGKAVLALIENQDRALSASLLAGLPREIRTELDALNLANKDLSQLEARLILLHGTDDTIIPYTESVDLHKAVGAEQSDLFLIDGLAHVDLHPLKLDQQAAWQAISAILEQRNAADSETAPCAEEPD